MKSIVLTIIIFNILVSCRQSYSKSGRQLLTENCISCHNYNASRSMYLPSILEMKEMAKTFLKIYNSALADSNHYALTRKLSPSDRDSICRFTMYWNNACEYPRQNK